MEEVTLTQEQLEALTEGGQYYTYLEEDEGSADSGGGAVVVGGGGSADELEGHEDDGEGEQQQQQVLLNQAEGQEVFVLDQGGNQTHFIRSDTDWGGNFFKMFCEMSS